MDQITYKPIGSIHSDHKAKEGVPIQGAFAKDSKGYVEVYPEYQTGITDLDGFSHIFLLYHFHLSKGYSLLTKPFLDDDQHGIFSIRAPKRPNPIGLSLVKLEKVVDNILHISEVDIIDNTPLLDIKPYISKIDSRSNTRNGWLTKKMDQENTYLSDDRYSE